MDTLDSSASNACVKTGVVIGIFSDLEFFPKMYLDRWIIIPITQENSKTTQLNWIMKDTHPVTSLKPVDPANLSTFPSTTVNGVYFLTCIIIWNSRGLR